MEKRGPKEHVHFIFYLWKNFESMKDLVNSSITISFFTFSCFFFFLNKKWAKIMGSDYGRRD